MSPRLADGYTVSFAVLLLSACALRWGWHASPLWGIRSNLQYAMTGAQLPHRVICLGRQCPGRQ
jgi:hypothetical protein